MPAPIARKDAIASYEPDDYLNDESSASSAPEAACYDEPRLCDDVSQCDITHPGELVAARGPLHSHETNSAERLSPPDYLTLSLGAGVIIGGDVAATLDRNGHLYLGIGGGVGASLTVGSVTLMAGQLLDSETKSGDDEHLRSFLQGDSVGVSASVVGAVGVTNAAADTATEIGLGVVQAGAQFQHNWHVLQLPVRW